VLLFLLFRLLGKRQKLKAEFFSSEKEGTPTTKKNNRDLTTKWDSLASDERRNRKQSSRRRRE